MVNTKSTMISSIRKQLGKMGWKVASTKKPVLADNEMLVRLEDVDLQVETNASYIANVYVICEYNTMDGDSIPYQIVNLIDELEHYIVHDSTEPGKATFKFVSSQADDLGELYRVNILLYYREVINLT
jgi:hypothetical protein